MLGGNWFIIKSKSKLNPNISAWIYTLSSVKNTMSAKENKRSEKKTEKKEKKEEKKVEEETKKEAFVLKPKKPTSPWIYYNN